MIGKFKNVFDTYQESVKKVIDTYTANETISALDIVRVFNGGISRAISNSGYDESKALGLALKSGISGSKIDVLIFGTYEDNFFSSFTVNDSLYLSNLSKLTNIVPSIPNDVYFTRCGKYLGNNTVLIQVEQPVLL